MGKDLAKVTQANHAGDFLRRGQLWKVWKGSEA